MSDDLCLSGRQSACQTPSKRIQAWKYYNVHPLNCRRTVSPFMLTTLLGLAAASVCILALVLVHRAAGFTRANAPVFAAFAGGVVVTLALVQLIPEAIALHPHTPWLVLGGFGIGFVLHALVGATDSAGGATRRLSSLTPVFAIAIHSALDGTVYAVTAALDVFTALSTSVGLIIHELPETLICFVLLQRAGLSDRLATVFAFLAAGATTLGAALLAAPFAQMLDPIVLGALFALVAGLLLHVGAAHLLSEAREAGWFKGPFAVFTGAGVAALMALAHAATHDHDHAPHSDHAPDEHGAHDHDHDHHHDHDH